MSLITREAEHLVHSYTEQSTHNSILKHLLDAKMHFFTAEHDLFDNQDSTDSALELRKSLEYLTEALSLAKDETKTSITNLIVSINVLLTLPGQNREAWKNDALIELLDTALANINEAQSLAPTVNKSKFRPIKTAILDLKKETLTVDLKTTYDSIMTDFNQTIKNL